MDEIKRKIIATVADHPFGVTEKAIASLLGLPLRVVAGQLEEMAKACELSVSTRVSENVKTKTYFKTLDVLPVPPKPAGNWPRKPTKIELAIEYLKEHGTADNPALRKAMAIQADHMPHPYLRDAVNDGRIIRDGKIWRLGDAKPAQEPAATEQPKPVKRGRRTKEKTADAQPPKVPAVTALAEVNTILQKMAVATPPATAEQFLGRAAALMAQRGQQYDQESGERSMGKAVQAFNLITGKSLSEPEGWLLLKILKDVRQWSAPGYHADSAEDGVAYSALMAESLAKEGTSA